jgi:hypothetical protein
MNPRIGQGALQDIRHVAVIPVRLGEWRVGGDGGQHLPDLCRLPATPLEYGVHCDSRFRSEDTS